MFLFFDGNFTWQKQFITTMATTGFLCGFLIGGRLKGLQFLAENSHKLPRKKIGWFYYHKFKRNEIIHFGMISGLKYSIKFGLIASLFSLTEMLLEIKTESILASTGAGLFTALSVAKTCNFTNNN